MLSVGINRAKASGGGEEGRHVIPALVAVKGEGCEREVSDVGRFTGRKLYIDNAG